MKLLIASDIHGSASACRQLLTRFEEERADKLLLLGDILYHGPRNDLPDEYAPKEVIALLNEVKDRLLCVRGNCDCEVDQMVLHFPILADYALLPLDSCTVYATHGHHNDALLPLLQGTDAILLHGHTHIPTWDTVNGVRIFNPGSTSIPKEGSKKSYMVYENGTFAWKELMRGETYHVESVE